ncbi:MAG: hypothetical protein DRH12_09605 [Deltaproteobacteria bacterium]|nr:MAG: hypothetical protein DRH12_09605 [Deltaproteobacteria bacterium]
MAQQVQKRVEALEARISRLLEEQQGRGHHIVVARVQEDKCIACGICENVCPTHAVHVEETAIIDPDMCRGCGWCAQECPEGAISLTPLEPREAGNRSRYGGAGMRINRRGYYGGDFL